MTSCELYLGYLQYKNWCVKNNYQIVPYSFFLENWLFVSVYV